MIGMLLLKGDRFNEKILHRRCFLIVTESSIEKSGTFQSRSRWNFCREFSNYVGSPKKPVTKSSSLRIRPELPANFIPRMIFTPSCSG